MFKNRKVGYVPWLWKERGICSMVLDSKGDMFNGEEQEGGMYSIVKEQKGGCVPRVRDMVRKVVP